MNSKNEFKVQYITKFCPIFKLFKKRQPCNNGDFSPPGHRCRIGRCVEQTVASRGIPRTTKQPLLWYCANMSKPNNPDLCSRRASRGNRMELNSRWKESDSQWPYIKCSPRLLLSGTSRFACSVYLSPWKRANESPPWKICWYPVANQSSPWKSTFFIIIDGELVRSSRSVASTGPLRRGHGRGHRPSQLECKQ